MIAKVFCKNFFKWWREFKSLEREQLKNLRKQPKLLYSNHY